jgi:hypothetical protein
MALSGQAKTDYQRMYMHLKRSGAPKPAEPAMCSFCGEAGNSDRLLVGDQNCFICEQCITLAVARIAEVRRRRKAEAEAGDDTNRSNRCELMDILDGD